MKSTILWSFLSGGQAIPAAISGLRSMGILFASGSLRIASVLHQFLHVMVNIISSQVPCGQIGNCFEQNYTSTMQNRSLKAQTIELHAAQAGKRRRTEGGRGVYAHKGSSWSIWTVPTPLRKRLITL